MERILVSTADIASVFGKTRQTINKYVNEGMPKVGKGEYDLVECVRWYIKKLEHDIKVAKQGGETSAELQRKLMKVKTELKEIELKRIRGELIDTNVVLKAFEELTLIFKQSLLSLPNKISAVVLSLNNPGQVKEYMEKQIYEILESISLKLAGREYEVKDE